MKHHPLKPALWGLLLASALTAVSVSAQSAAVDPAAPVQVKPDNRLTKNISGKLAAKTATTMTVDGRTVTITSATTYAKGSALIGSGDVKVGDTINIVTSDDGQVAVSVNVLASM
jgi:hypothetical protein